MKIKKTKLLKRLGTTKLNYLGVLILGLLLGIVITGGMNDFHNNYSLKIQSPIVLQLPVVIWKKPKLADILIESSNSATPVSTPSASPKKLNLNIEQKLELATTQMFGSIHWAAMYNLISHESGFQLAIVNRNSGACGLGQAYPCQKLLDKCGALNDVNCQIDWVLSYVQDRYGNPTAAWQFWQERHPVLVNGVWKDVGNWY